MSDYFCGGQFVMIGYDNFLDSHVNKFPWTDMIEIYHLSDTDLSYYLLFLSKYLELRFSRATRLLGTVLFIVQTVSKKPVNT